VPEILIVGELEF